MADYNDRIVVYLKAPDAGKAALIDAQKFTDRGLPSDVSKFSSPFEVKRGEEVTFIMSATKTGDATKAGVANLHCLMVYWPDGCRIMTQVLLGEKGNNVGDKIGVGYKDGPADACHRLYCRFNAAGILTCEDRQGVTLITDVAKPGNVALCLALMPQPGSTAEVKFPGGERGNQSSSL